MNTSLPLRLGVVALGGMVMMLVSLASAAAADDIRIKLPECDLTTSQKPLEVTVAIPDTLPAEGTASVELQRAEPGLTKPVVLTSTVKLPAATGATGRTFEISLAAGALAEGEYKGTLTVTVGETKQTAELTMFRMAEGRPADFPVGIYSLYFSFKRDPETKANVPDKEEHLRLLRDAHAAGINLVEQHMQGMGDLNWTMSQAARIGIRFMPSTNTSAASGFPPGDDAIYVYANGEKPQLPNEWQQHCLFTPKTREAANAEFQRCVREYAAHPDFSGLIYYGDDFAMPSRQVDGKTVLTCYCPRCTAAFKALTGQDPPKTCEPLSGVIPHDNVMLRWMRFRTEQVYGGFYAEMEKAKNAVDETAAVGPIHGWSLQPFSNLLSGQYGPLTQRVTAVSSYTYPGMSVPRMDFINQFEIGKMGNRQKDVWMLGSLTYPMVGPAWCVYQNYWNMLAAGYRLIGYFAWQEPEWTVRHEAAMKHVMTPEEIASYTNRWQVAVAALTRCAQHKDWVLPTAGLWTPTESRNAVLYSFTTETFDVVPVNRGWKHESAVLGFMREALRQHVPMKAICEDEIRGGMLKDLDTLSLCDARALPDDVVKILEDWAAAGGKLYVDDQTELRPKGAKAAPVATIVTLIGDATKSPAHLDSRDVTLRELEAGDARYYVFINNYTDRYSGLSRGDAQDVAMVRDEPVETTVSFTDQGRYLFDMSTGKAVGPTSKPLSLSLEPSWGRALIALPAPSATLKVSEDTSARQGGRARFKLETVDPAGKPVRGAFTVKVDIQTPSRRSSRYSCYFGLMDGAGEFRLPLGINDEVGTWTITFEGGLPRTQITRQLQVTAGPEPRQLLSAKAVTEP